MTRLAKMTISWLALLNALQLQGRRVFFQRRRSVLAHREYSNPHRHRLNVVHVSTVVAQRTRSLSIVLKYKQPNKFTFFLTFYYSVRLEDAEGSLSPHTQVGRVLTLVLLRGVPSDTSSRIFSPLPASVFARYSGTVVALPRPFLLLAVLAPARLCVRRLPVVKRKKSLSTADT